MPKFEIGYWCRKQFLGEGYITEAMRGITRFGFETLGARRIEIRCDSRHAPSQRVAGGAGYQLEATLRNDRASVDGQLSDTLIFAMFEALTARPGGAEDVSLKFTMKLRSSFACSP